MTTPYLRADITHDEGCRLDAYEDTVGVWTCGVGHAGVKPGTVWTEDEALDQLATDMASALAGLDHYLPWWRTLNDVRQDVLANMAFNLGVRGLLGFRHALAYIREGRFAGAGAELLASTWARQVGARASRLARQLETGVRVAP